MRALFLLLLLSISLAVTACASKPKSSTVLHAGDSPSIQYVDREAAGGPVVRRRYQER